MKYAKTAADSKYPPAPGQETSDAIRPAYSHASHLVDGFILQGPVSDREAIGLSMTPKALQESIKVAKQLEPQAFMPLEHLPSDMARDSAVRASRWLSLAEYG